MSVMRISMAASLAFAVLACSAPQDEKRLNTLPVGDSVYSDMWTLASMTDELDTLIEREPSRRWLRTASAA